jgi:hypothetical protein
MKKAIILCLVSSHAFAQKAPPVKHELRGVVTYFFNTNQGYRPDVGATAYIIKDKVLPADSLDVVAAEAYRSANVIYSLSSGEKKNLLPGEESPREAYLSAKARLARAERRLAKHGVVATADGQGVFSKKLAPGTYWVLIQSASRTTAQMKRVVIASDDVEVAAKFEAD